MWCIRIGCVSIRLLLFFNVFKLGTVFGLIDPSLKEDKMHITKDVISKVADLVILWSFNT